MEKLNVDNTNLPANRWLGGNAKAPTLAALFMALALLFTACTYAAPTDPPEVDQPEAPAAAQPQERVIPVANALEPAVEVHSDLGFQTMGLDPNAVVAAQEQVLTGIYDRLVPSVVQVRTYASPPQGTGSGEAPSIPFNFGGRGGAGFVWDDQGRIVTNHHVIDGAERITVTFSDRTEFEAEVLGSDPDSDLAVLQVEETDYPMPAVELGDSSMVKSGHFAFAIGNPFGQEFTITSGIVSAVGRTIRSGNSPFSIPQVIQTDAPMNPGNSGGPLLDRRGRVIGVSTQIITRAAGSNSGIGFAVPINTAKKVVPTLIEDGKYEYAWLGISGASVTGDLAEANGHARDIRGSLIIDVFPDGPADLGGVKGSESTVVVKGIEYPVGGDIIIGVNGTSIDGMNQLIAYLIDNSRPGDEVQVEVLRHGGEEATLTVELGTRPGSRQ